MTRKPYLYYNNNPLHNNVSDCVVRAIALATKTPWTMVLLGLTAYAISLGCMPNDAPAYEEYLKNKGWKKRKQPIYLGRVITGKTFLKRIRRKSDIIVSIGKQHLTVIHHGKFRDTWDCSNEVVGNYWTFSRNNKTRHEKENFRHNKESAGSRA